MAAERPPEWWHELSRRVSSRVGFVMRERELGKLRPVMERELRGAGIEGWPAYLRELDAQPLSAAVWQSLLGHILIHETSFFRHAQQFDFVRDVILTGRDGSVRLWSAGCSSGEEAFSLAIACLEAGRPSAEIWATDVSHAGLRRAMEGRVVLRRGEPSPRLARWVHEEADGWHVAAPVRALIRWQWGDLLDGAEFAARRGPFDVIMCRNVVLYLHEEAIDRILAVFERALVPDGWLMLGHAESLLFRRTSFHMVADGLAYTRRPPAPSARRQVAEPASGELPATPTSSEPGATVKAALALEERGQAMEAAAHLRRGLRGDDGDLIIRLCLAGVCRRIGQTDAAADELVRLARQLAGRPDDELVPGGDGLTVGSLRQVVALHVTEEAG